MSPNKYEVKNLYAAIVKQALKDWKAAVKKDDPFRKDEIRRFFKSDWGEHILDVLEIDVRIIDEKYEILK